MDGGDEPDAKRYFHLRTILIDFCARHIRNTRRISFIYEITCMQTILALNYKMLLGFIVTSDTIKT